MKKSRFWRTTVAWALGGLVLGSGLASAQAFDNPPIRMANGIEFMDGGRSQAEAQFLQTVAPRWAATLEFAVSQGPRGAFPADVAVRVRDKYSGRPVMTAQAHGPFLLARLDPGTYDVEATVDGLTLTQSLTVFGGMASRALFLWPSNVALGITPTPALQAVAAAAL